MAAADIFIKFEGPVLKGESKEKKHLDEIEVGSFSKSVAQEGSFGSGGGGGAGKAHFGEYVFTKFIDLSSPMLEKACATGQHYDKVTISCRKAGGKQEEYYTVTLEHVLVASYSLSISGGSGRPMESFALNFGKLLVSYQEQTLQGGLAAQAQYSYDIAAQNSA